MVVCVKIFCSGIGGIGISAYASLQKLAGHEVSGSDRSASPLTEDLRSQGIPVSFDQSGKALEDGTELFVYSEAIPAEAPERMRASVLGIRQLSYPQALGELLRGSRVIAVCGTHGKSSTTAMAGRLLIEAGMDPTIVVGTKMRELNGRNWRRGTSGLFLIEACEYRRSFLRYRPDIILFTNCDGDHFDYYASLNDYRHAFREFFSNVSPGGTVIAHGGDPDSIAIAKERGRKVVDADAYPLMTLATPGLHMRQNARLVLALAEILGIPQMEAISILSGYAGSWRRIEVKGGGNGVTVIDDYAHHPAEIRATIDAVRSGYPGRRVVAVFQPHTHDRTLKLYDDFTRAFSGADTVIIPNIYVARKEMETNAVDVDRFVADIERSSRVRAVRGKSLGATERMLREDILRKGDVLLCMGAGDVTGLAARMATTYQE